MASSSSQLALHAYRDLLRSARIAFQGDTRLLTPAISQARSAFEANRSTPPATPEYEAAVKHASDVARLLRENVVQGVKAEYGMEKGEKGEKWKLRIHEYTERGDNDSIKKGGKGISAASMADGCCGGVAAR